VKFCSGRLLGAGAVIWGGGLRSAAPCVDFWEAVVCVWAAQLGSLNQAYQMNSFC